MIRNALSAMVAVLMLAGAARANPGWVTQDLNFRTGPGTGYGVVAALPACTRIHVYDHYNGWYRVTWRGLEGWVSARYVADDPAYCQPPRPRHHHKPHSAPPRGNSYHYHYYY